jgi:NAD(P)-dependent dehydrogenase (short-subunit alcohol dehydrogenase family)
METGLDLTSRVAVVIGSSRGLGRLIALELARAGADVVVAARTAEENLRIPGTIHKTAAEVEALGRRALPVRCDTTDEASVAAMVEQTIGALGRIDILVNSAGIVILRTFQQTDLKRLDTALKVNLRGPYIAMKAVVPHMVERGHGHVINLAGFSSAIGDGYVIAGFPAYTASKAALVRLGQAMAVELAPSGVGVVALTPSRLVETEGWRVSGNRPLPRQEPGEYVAHAAAWIASRDPLEFSGRFVDSQHVLAAAGLLHHPPADPLEGFTTSLDALRVMRREADG